jgi:MFS family permease
LAGSDTRRKGNLWHHREFLRFWTGDTIVQFTGSISGLALGVVAVLTLKANGFQLGVIVALGFIAFPTMGLFVGVWMDRMKRKPVMIAADIIQVVALGSVPLSYVLGVLSLYQLYGVSLVMGITTLFFDVAYQSYLPSLVEKEDVVEGNQKLQTSESASGVIGPSTASVLMQLVGAALTVTVDAVGTLVGALTLVSIRKPEPEPQPNPSGAGRSFFREMKEGIHVITGNSLLWTQAGCTGTSNLGSNMFSVAILIYALDTLGISQGVIGIVFSNGAVGFLVGVLISGRVTSAVGFGRSIALSTATAFGYLIVLLAHGAYAAPVIGVAFFVVSLGVPIYNINQVSLRQIITPNRLQGRMNATMRTLIWGTIPAGALLGGVLVVTVGAIPSIIVATLIMGSSVLWIVLGPIIKLKKQPEPLKE